VSRCALFEFERNDGDEVTDCTEGMDGDEARKGLDGDELKRVDRDS
jgi:hypothetical protein